MARAGHDAPALQIVLSIFLQSNRVWHPPEAAHVVYGRSGFQTAQQATPQQFNKILRTWTILWLGENDRVVHASLRFRCHEQFWICRLQPFAFVAPIQSPEQETIHWKTSLFVHDDVDLVFRGNTPRSIRKESRRDRETKPYTGMCQFPCYRCFMAKK